MPWPERSTVELRREFVELAVKPGANIRALARRYRISPTTAYKFIHRFRSQGPQALQNQSRVPRSQPTRSSADVEAPVLAVRDEHPAWGARKIRAWLVSHGQASPAPSTIQSILRRHDRLRAEAIHPPYRRFERLAPNDLWQMDFKGHFSLQTGRCHPLTILDDHSRYSVAIDACGNETEETVRDRLLKTFRRSGLPWAMLMDNGSPWGKEHQGQRCFTDFEVWLIRLGVEVIHGRPLHPQTQGKDERFHRTLKTELLGTRVFEDLDSIQRAFDRWRLVYNNERPHEALGLKPPISRYRQSQREFPEALPPIEYGATDVVRTVQAGGWVDFRGHHMRVGKAFRGQPVAFRPTTLDGAYRIYFCQQLIAEVDLASA